MIDPSSYLLFLGACLALIVLPGPGQVLVIARTLAEGRRAGVLTAIGLNIGTLCHAVAAATGLSSILASSPMAFAVVRYAGAAYLAWLGIRALRRPASTASPEADRGDGPARSPSLRAIVTGVMNPKVALFFLAFLPQFVDPARPVLLQFLVLGATLAVLDAACGSGLAWVVSRVRPALPAIRLPAVWQRRACGSVLIGLGLRLAALK